MYEKYLTEKQINLEKELTINQLNFGKKNNDFNQESLNEGFQN